MNNTELTQKSISATFWSGLDTLSRYGVQFFVSVALARLLTPKEFGLIGMLSLFIGIAGLFVDSGFSSALTQKRNISQEEKSSVFYFNVVIGLIMAIALATAAPLIAEFFELPILTPLTRIMALNLVVTSFGSVHWALLNKELNFRRGMKINLIATIMSGSLAITLAWFGWGVWSLAIQSVAYSVTSTAVIWIMYPWRPAIALHTRALRSLFGFGSFVLLTGILNTFYTRLNTLIIGKMYSAGDLGLYSRAYSTQQLPTSLISAIVNRVAFPIFSTAADDKDLLRRGCRKAVVGIMLINLPMMAGLVAVARPLVLTLFGDKWAPCIPYLQILSLAGLLWPFQIINPSVIAAQGRSDLLFRLEIMKDAIGLAFLLIACQISVAAIAWSMVAHGAVCFFLNGYYTGKLIQYPALRQIRDILPYLGASGAVFILVWPISLLESLEPAVLLILQIITGICVYILVGYIFKLRDFMDFVRRITDRIQAVKNPI